MKLLRGATVVFGLLFAGVAQAANPNLEGVWVIAKPIKELTPVDQKAAPLTAEGQKTYRQNKALAAKKDYSYDYTVSRCSSPGMPRMMLTTQPFKIIQRTDIVLALFKWNHMFGRPTTRRLPMSWSAKLPITGPSGLPSKLSVTKPSLSGKRMQRNH